MIPCPPLYIFILFTAFLQDCNAKDAQEVFDGKYAQEVAEWERVADAGGATSASPPSSGLLGHVAITPPNPDLPLPYRKTQLAAAKRLERELKAGKGKERKEPAHTKTTKVVQKKPAVRVQEKKTKQEKVTKPKDAHGKPKNAASQGPLQATMKAFIESAKSSGNSHQEALQLWRNSEERASVVNAMPESERKRRRYS